MPVNPSSQNGSSIMSATDLVVEDGTIVDGANTYVDVQFVRDEADLICVNLNGFSDDQIACYLIKGTRYLDDRSFDYSGCVATDDQETSWPRIDAYRRGSIEIAEDVIPKELKRALVMIVIAQSEGVLLYPKAINSADQTGTYISEEKIGPLSIKTKAYPTSNVLSDNLDPTAPIEIPEVEAALQPILKSSRYTHANRFPAIRV